MNRREFNRIIAALPLLGTAAVAQAQTATQKPLKMDLFQVSARRKPDQEWGEHLTRTVGHLRGYERKRDRPLGIHFGLPSDKTKKTGFWHVEKHGNRFWLVDPEGNLNIHRAICSVNRGTGEQQKKAFSEKFGTPEKWGDATIRLLRDHFFNGTGSWTDTNTLTTSPLHQTKPLAHTVNLALMTDYGGNRSWTVPGHRGYPNDVIFVFEPEFKEFCDRTVAQKVAALKNDPNLLGYFTDNELPFRTTALEGYLKNDPDDPGRKAAEVWLAARNKTKEQIEDADRWAFLGYVGDTYSSITASAIRKHDPNHLVLGPRLHGDTRSRTQLMKGIGKHIDIISFNYYGVWTPQEEHTKGWTEWTGKPFMTTEWYTKGEDVGLPNMTGAGWNVKTQKDRGLFYQNYTLALLECKNCVGWHWFKYQDNDPTHKNPEPSNIDANKGIVNSDYEPHKDLMEQMREINEQVFDLIEYFDS